MQKLLYFEAVTWQRLLTLEANKTIPRKHLDLLRSHLELLVAFMSILRLAPAWRKRALVAEVGNVLVETEGAMREFRDLLIGQRIGCNWNGTRTLIRTWNAIRYDARTILRARGWRERHGLTLVHSVATAANPKSEDRRLLRDMARATKGMSPDEVKETIDEFFKSRAGGQG